jgi:polysaccharide export outer membrane protein
LSSLAGAQQRPAQLHLAQAQGAAELAAAGLPASQRPLVQLDRGDTITIQVFGQPDLGGTVYVADDGTVPVALAGPVQVAGLSPSEAAKRIEAALRGGKFMNDPHVTITVTQSPSRQVSVLGEVGRPGRYPIDAGAKIMDVLAEAGGTKETGADIIYLVRTSDTGNTDRFPIDLKGLQDPMQPVPAQSLQAGDQIFVPKAPSFSIYGEVASPAKYRIEDGMTVEQGIARAGGLKPSGSMHRIEVQRRDGTGHVQKIKLRASDLIQPDDVIRVKESIF